MARGPMLKPLVLTDAEIAQLTAWSRRPKSARAVAEHARIILACANGAPSLAVADAVGVTGQTVGKWRTRFLAQGLPLLSADASQASCPDIPHDGRRCCYERLRDRRVCWSNELDPTGSRVSRSFHDDSLC